MRVLAETLEEPSAIWFYLRATRVRLGPCDNGLRSIRGEWKVTETLDKAGVLEAVEYCLNQHGDSAPEEWLFLAGTRTPDGNLRCNPRIVCSSQALAGMIGSLVYCYAADAPEERQEGITEELLDGIRRMTSELRAVVSADRSQ